MFLLKIRSDDDFKYIIGYSEVDNSTTFDGTRFVVVSQKIFQRVKENFLTKRMKFPAYDRNVGPENLMFDDDIDINDVKNSAMATYRQRHVDIHFDSDFNIMSVQFVLLNNIFASKGYHFTDSNREEIYLDILNSGDVELIGMLEQFLDLFNEYNDYKYHIDIYMNMKLETKECTSIPDVHAVYEKFAKETLLHGMNSDN